MQLYIDQSNDGHWLLVAEAVDTGGNSDPIIARGNAGVISDYMNVEFSNYSVNTFGADIQIPDDIIILKRYSSSTR